MSFFNLRRGGSSSQSQSGAPAENLDTVRKRAKHRLIGAAVLVLVGVVGFPLLFDSQPRPIPVDIALRFRPDKVSNPLRPQHLRQQHPHPALPLPHRHQTLPLWRRLRPSPASRLCLPLRLLLCLRLPALQMTAPEPKHF